MSHSGQSSSARRQGRDDDSVEFLRFSNVSLAAMKKLVAGSDKQMENHVCFPLDDRIIHQAELNGKYLRKLDYSIINAFETISAPSKQPDKMLPHATANMDSVILGTKDGTIYCIKKEENVHKRLRNYFEIFKPHCTTFTEFMPIEGSCVRIGDEFAILILTDYIRDKTYLRRARRFEDAEGSPFFLELDTGTVRHIDGNKEYKSSRPLEWVFQEPSAVTQYQLVNSDNMLFQDILKKMISLAHTKQLRIIRHEELHDIGWTQIVEINDDFSEEVLKAE